jgi:hypothetical protein
MEPSMHPQTAHQRLATFNAHHSHALFLIAQTFIDQFAPAFPPVRTLVNLETKADRFDFACVVSALCKHAHDLDAVIPIIDSIGECLGAHGFTTAHTAPARAALLSALRRHAGKELTIQLEQDWTEVVNAFFARMDLVQARPMRMAA